ncbi:hypothetical protein [Maribacter polysiphoniae]|uniref:hypothetical protein n=1 Tax=Maribacter polysiphoniae TaxID=429344 RepID=UPI0023542CCB|nr:hypothetical protein [Maribacter polysiphoniae]
MENSKDSLNHHLGILFYAVAMADKKVHEKEHEMLKKKLSEALTQQGENPEDLTRNDALAIEGVFSRMQKINAESSTCFKQFCDYFDKNPSRFTPRLRKWVWNIAQAIASSSAQKNKSELILLGKLRLLFETQSHPESDNG